MWQIVMIVIALFAAIVIIISIGRSFAQSKNLSNDCINQEGECVLPALCSSCSTFADCNVKYPFVCGEKDNVRLICCPREDVISNDNS